MADPVATAAPGILDLGGALKSFRRGCVYNPKAPPVIFSIYVGSGLDFQVGAIPLILFKAMRIAIASFAVLLASCASKPAQMYTLETQTTFDNRVQKEVTHHKYCKWDDPKNCYTEHCSGVVMRICSDEGDPEIKQKYVENLKPRIDKLKNDCGSDEIENCVASFRNGGPAVQNDPEAKSVLCSKPQFLCRTREIHGALPPEKWIERGMRYETVARTISEVAENNRKVVEVEEIIWKKKK